MKEHATHIVRELRNRGFQAYFAGGCVRDMLLGLAPADYDVATDATPAEVMRVFPETYAVGAQFGVVLVPLKKENSSAGSFSDRSEKIPTQAKEAWMGHPASSDSTEKILTDKKAGRTHPENPHPSKGSLDGAPAKQVESDAPVIGALSESGFSDHPNYVEVATFRNDGAYSDGRHPDQVSYAKSPQEDVQRRDFTINGLLMDPLDGHRVLDFVGGRADLQAQIIRAIGDPERRFSEDKLRMLRAVRFAARFDYEIESATFAAMQRLAPGIEQVSKERVRDELTKMLTEGHARRAFELLDVSGLLKQALPEIARMHGVEQPPQFHPEGDVWVHTLLLLEKLPPRCSRTLAWGTLLHDVGKPPTFRIAPDRIRFDNHAEVGVRMAEEICRRLHFSNDDTKQIAAIVANHMRFADVERMKESTLKRFMRLPKFEEHLEMHRLDCLSSHGDLSLYDFVRERLQDTPVEEIRPKPLLKGEDLIELGYSPGPQFRTILSAVEDGQLEGALKSREDAVQFVRREFPRAS